MQLSRVINSPWHVHVFQHFDFEYVYQQPVSTPVLLLYVLISIDCSVFASFACFVYKPIFGLRKIISVQCNSIR